MGFSDSKGRSSSGPPGTGVADSSGAGSSLYLTNSKVQGALRLLLDNLNTAGIPMALISQYMPVQYARVHAGILPPKAEDLLMDRVGDCIDDYLYAVLRD